RFGPVAGAKLLEDVLDVNLYGTLGPTDEVGDIPIAVPACQQLEHFRLARSKSGPRRVLRQLRRDDTWYRASPAVNGTNHVEHVGAEHILEQISFGPGIQRAVDIFISVVGREHHDPRLGEL